MLLTTLVLLLVFGGSIYLYLIWNFGYWRKRGVKEPKAYAMVGSFPSAFNQKRHMVYDIDDIYRKYKKDENFVGIFSSRTPQILVTCPELARKVMVSDFKHFHDNEASQMVDKNSDLILASNPFTLTGSAWKETRAEITPGLSNNRIKAVYPVTMKVCNKLSNYLRQHIRAPPKEGINTKDICFRFTSEIVSDCVLGIQAECFSQEPAPIMGMIKKIFDQSFVVILYQILISLAPWIRNIYKFHFVPKYIEHYFVDLVQKAIDMRRGGDQKLRERNDFLNYMLQLQDKKNLPTMTIAAHTMTFLLDGFETTASVIAHCLLLLARSPEKLRKLYEEIAAHLDAKGDLDFETLNDLPYLDACIHESIRIFPPGLFSNKLCTEPIEFVNKNGQILEVKQGQVVIVPMGSFMFDEEFYPNPQQFQPERFLEEPDGLKNYREKGLYYGFGDGPRICLGMRFGLSQSKAAVVEIVKNFHIKVNPKTREDNRLDPAYFLARLQGGVWLDFEARSDVIFKND